MYSAYEGIESTLSTLIKKGADVNCHEKLDGQTALMWAAFNGHTTAVYNLLDAGANINAKDRHGQTALMFAVRNNKINVVKLLLNKGASHTIKSKAEESALDIAYKSSFKHIISQLKKLPEAS